MLTIPTLCRKRRREKRKNPTGCYEYLEEKKKRKR